MDDQLTLEPAADTVSCRLIVRNRLMPVAMLYPLSAGPYTLPVATLALDPGQELPLLEPGAVVDARSDFTEVIADGVRIQGTRSSGADVEGQSIFAERGDVLVHPAAVGWRRTWREVRPESVGTIAEYERRIKSARRAGIALIALLVVMVVVLVLEIAHGDVHGVVYFGGTSAGSGGGALTAWRRSRAADRALERARRTEGLPTVAMHMRLWWSVGFGQGPVAVATLWPDGSRSTGPAVRHVRVAGVPDRFEPADGVMVRVCESPTDDEVSGITCGDVTLWPIDVSSADAHQAVLYAGSHTRVVWLAIVGTVGGILLAVLGGEFAFSSDVDASTVKRLVIAIILIPLGVSWFAAALLHLREGIAVSDREVTVKSRFRTRRFAWHDVEDFAIVRRRALWPNRSTVELRTNDGRLARPGSASHRTGHADLLAACASLNRAKSRSKDLVQASV